MKKYACIVACMISACAAVPERVATSINKEDVGSVERKIFDVATRCWSKKTSFWNSIGYKIVDGRGIGFYRIESYSYDMEGGRGQAEITIEITQSDDVVVVTARQSEATRWFSSTPGADLEMRWQDAKNWIKGNYICSFKSI